MKGTEVVKLLRKNGWDLDRINGSHHMMVKDGKTVSVPAHNKDMKRGTLNKILKDTGLK